MLIRARGSPKSVTPAMTHPINAMDADALRNEVQDLKDHPEKCRIDRTLTAEWVGGTRARIAGRNKELHIGGAGDFGAMSVALASFLACEVDVIATHATLRGIELERLSIEGNGRFDLGRYMGAAPEPSSGFQKIGYTVRIKAKNATPEQLRELVKLCETHSPVGDSLARAVPLELKVEVE